MKKILNINTILIGLVLIFGLGGMLLMNLDEETGKAAVVSVAKSDEEIRIPLSEDGTHYIDGYLPTTLIVEDGTIRFANSVCPDHLCEAYGAVSEEYDIPACLPAGVVVTIELEE